MITPISIVAPILKTDFGVKFWVQTRNSNDDYNGLLEFPGGKVEEKETPQLAAVREVLEETQVSISQDNLVKFKNYDFKIGDKTILLMVFLFFDSEALFFESGYYTSGQLLGRDGSIPPKNREILVDLDEYFRILGAKKGHK